MEIKLIRADITKLKVDAIVNAANQSLLGGGGVDGAIHRAAGPGLLKECRELNGCKTGQAKITKAYLLPARYVIHTVGPIYAYESREMADKLLADAYTNSLYLAEKNGLASIAFPNISTGVYGFPKQAAATIATRSVKDFILRAISVQSVWLCCFDEENFRIYQQLLERN